MFKFIRTSIRPSLRKQEVVEPRYQIDRRPYTIAQVQYLAQQLADGRSPFPVYTPKGAILRNGDGSFQIPPCVEPGTYIDVPTGPAFDSEVFAVFECGCWILMPATEEARRYGCDFTVTHHEIPVIGGKPVLTANCN